MSSIKFNSIPPKRLAQTITSASTNFQVGDIFGFDGIPLTATIVGTLAYGSFQNLTGTQLELFSYDPTTLSNASGINFVSRGLQFNEDGTFTAVPTNALTWVKGITIVQLGTDAPAIFAWLKNYIDAASIAGAVPASTTALGITKLSIAPVSSLSPISVGDNDTRLLTSANATAVTALLAGIIGTIHPFAGRTAPTGFLMCDGSSVSRSTFASLFAVICSSQTMTMTIASPAVVTATAHGLVAGDKIHFTTTGGLPSGVSTNTDYYVLAASLATNTFEFALSSAGTAVVSTGSQSGIHTIYKSAYGKGDGLTTFNVPDFRAKSLMGSGSSTTNITLSFEGGAVNTGADTIAVPDLSYPSQGQNITLTTTGTLPGGLSTATTYYVIRNSSTSISLAASQDNATNKIAINITDTGSAGGVHTIVYVLTTRSILGQVFGEETHGMSNSEMPIHTHTGAVTAALPPAGSANYFAANNSTSPTGPSGGNALHNNISPMTTVNWLIKT